MIHGPVRVHWVPTWAPHWTCTCSGCPAVFRSASSLMIVDLDGNETAAQVNQFISERLRKVALATLLANLGRIFERPWSYHTGTLVWPVAAPEGVRDDLTIRLEDWSAR